MKRVFVRGKCRLMLAVVPVLLLLISSSSYACLHAEYARIFPIGLTHNNQIVALQCRLTRGEYDDEMLMRAQWWVISDLVLFDSLGNVLARHAIDTGRFVEEKHYRDEDSVHLAYLNDTYERSLRLAGDLGYVYEWVTLADLTFCGFGQSCSKGSYQFDPVDKIPTLRTGITTIALYSLLDTASIPFSMLMQQYEEGDQLESFEDYPSLGIGSVRSFRVGERLIRVIHLAGGSGGLDPETGESLLPEKEREPSFSFIGRQHGLYVEPILHHGQGCDFVMIAELPETETVE